MDHQNTWRIVLMGKGGVGKSSLANTIFGEPRFQINRFDDSKTQRCQVETKMVRGRSFTLIDTPGFFDTDRLDDELKPEILRCTTECAPGPHAFLIVLKVEKFTEHEQAVITRICQYSSEDVFKYAAVVFTRGDQLPEGTKLEDYVLQSEGLSDLVKKCGGRCHVVDNKYWQGSQEDQYRSNVFQVEEIFKSVEKIVMGNNGGYYTNEMLREAERAIQDEEARIGRSSENTKQEEIRQQAKSNVFNMRQVNKLCLWLRRLLRLAVVAGILVPISAVFMKVFMKAPHGEVNVETPEGKPDNVILAPVKVIQKTFAVIMDRLNALYERTYNPFNPSE